MTTPQPDPETPPAAPAAPDDVGVYRSTLPGPLGWIDNAIAQAEAVLLAAGVLLMAANTVANVVGRFVFASSIQATEEINRFLIILITFAGISYAARHGRHIRMTALFDMAPAHLRKILMIFIALVTAAFMFGLTWYSWGYLQTTMGRGRLLPSLQIQVWWTVIWVPVGFFMTGLQYLLTAIKNVLEHDIYLSTNVLEGYTDENEQEI